MVTNAHRREDDRSTPPVTAADERHTGRDLVADLWTRSLSREHGFEPLEVEGKLPPDLDGTIFRNGPGLFELFGQKVGHPFEADGAVSAIRIVGGAAAGAARITRSAGLEEERAAGRPLYGFGVPWRRRFANVLRSRQKNTANTSVMFWNGRLFALMEAAKPTEIDPRDLTTLGETDLDGVVVSAFSAHPHRVESRKTTYNFGLQYGRFTKLHLYALPDGAPARHLGALDLRAPLMVHDFVATDRHLVFFLGPANVVIRRALLALGGFDDLFEWRGKSGTEIIVVPIDDPGRATRFTVDPFWQWHFTNAYERAGEIVVDYARYPDFASFHELGAATASTNRDAPRPPRNALGAARYHRAVIDPARRSFRSDELLAQRACEFPEVHPSAEGGEHRYAWLVLDELGAIGRLDTKTGKLREWTAPADVRVSEPIFVPRAGATDETDGHVLSLCLDGATDRSFLAVLDGRRVADGPVARCWFDHALPITFHGVWAPRVR